MAKQKRNVLEGWTSRVRGLLEDLDRLVNPEPAPKPVRVPVPVPVRPERRPKQNEPYR
ncbi:MAG: hypothetical protein SNJ59_10865 [Aggregatilineales bacterium]